MQDLSATSAPGQPPDSRLARRARFVFYTRLAGVAGHLFLAGRVGNPRRPGPGSCDREACIKGILDRHRGRGWFTSPGSGGINEYHIDGSARDTFAAFESLRILGALDRVKDLARWQFRPRATRDAKDQLTWDEVEAWVCQQRLEKSSAKKRKIPKRQPGSLLQN